MTKPAWLAWLACFFVLFFICWFLLVFVLLVFVLFLVRAGLDCRLAVRKPASQATLTIEKQKKDLNIIVLGSFSDDPSPKLRSISFLYFSGLNFGPWADLLADLDVRNQFYVNKIVYVFPAGSVWRPKNLVPKCQK